jgi:hypothetical protein
MIDVAVASFCLMFYPQPETIFREDSRYRRETGKQVPEQQESFSNDEEIATPGKIVVVHH